MNTVALFLSLYVQLFCLRECKCKGGGEDDSRATGSRMCRCVAKKSDRKGTQAGRGWRSGENKKVVVKDERR